MALVRNFKKIESNRLGELLAVDADRRRKPLSNLTSNQMKELNRRWLFMLILTCCVPSFALLCFDVLSRTGDLSSMVALRLAAAEEMASGRRPYVDFFDWSQPIVFQVFQLPVYLKHMSHAFNITVGVETAAKVMFLFCIAITVVLLSSLFCIASKSVADMDESRQLSQGRLLDVDAIAVPYVLSLVVFSSLARFEFGELQHLLILSFAPWVAWRALSLDSVRFPSKVSFLIGALCGLGCCLDLPYLLLPAALEIVCIIESKAMHKGVVYGWVGLATAVGLNLLWILTLNSQIKHAFFNWILPLKLFNYQILDECVHFVRTNSPDRSDIVYAMALAFLLALAGSRRSKRLLLLLSAVMAAGFGLFLLEQQGYTRDILIVIFACCSIMFLWAMQSVRRFAESRLLASMCYSRVISLSSIFASIVALSVVGSLTIANAKTLAAPKKNEKNRMRLLLSDGRPEPRDIEDCVSDHASKGAPITILCDHAGANYPMLANSGRRQSGYFLWGRPIRLLLAKAKERQLEGHWKEFYTHICTRLKETFVNQEPALVIVHDLHAKDFLRDAGLLVELERRYDVIESCLFWSDNQREREYVGFNWGFTVFQKRKLTDDN